MGYSLQHWVCPLHISTRAGWWHSSGVKWQFLEFEWIVITRVFSDTKWNIESSKKWQTFCGFTFQNIVGLFIYEYEYSWTRSQYRNIEYQRRKYILIPSYELNLCFTTHPTVHHWCWWCCCCWYQQHYCSWVEVLTKPATGNNIHMDIVFK